MNINFYYKSSFYQHSTAQIQKEPKSLKFVLRMPIVAQWGIWANREKNRSNCSGLISNSADINGFNL